MRFRWYGTGTPETVFVERKTHREAWAMEVSVKVGQRERERVVRSVEVEAR